MKNMEDMTIQEEGVSGKIAVEQIAWQIARTLKDLRNTRRWNNVNFFGEEKEL